MPGLIEQLKNKLKMANERLIKLANERLIKFAEELEYEAANDQLDDATKQAKRESAARCRKSANEPFKYDFDQYIEDLYGNEEREKSQRTQHSKSQSA